MDNLPELIILLTIVTAVSLYFYSWYKDMALLRTVTNINRGTRSERRLVLQLLKQGIQASNIFHDLYLEKSPGNYSQIDVVAVTDVGIIAFEVKDYSGWIFGKGNQQYWTQVLAYGREKYKFYNPIMQNNGHIEALQKRLSVNAGIPIFSVIIFYGSCTLKDVALIPDDTYIGYFDGVKRIVEHINNNNAQAFYYDKQSVITLLRQAVANGDDPYIVKRHIQNVKRYSNKTDGNFGIFMLNNFKSIQHLFDTLRRKYKCRKIIK